MEICLYCLCNYCICSTHMEFSEYTWKRSFNFTKYSIFKKAKFILISSLIIGFGSSIFWTFSRTYLAVEYKMSSAESSLFWVIMGVSGVVGGFVGGLINRIGLTLSYCIAIIVMAASISIITIPTTTTIYLSSVFVGIAYIFITGILIVWSSHKFTHAINRISLSSCH